MFCTVQLQYVRAQRVRYNCVRHWRHNIAPHSATQSYNYTIRCCKQIRIKSDDELDYPMILKISLDGLEEKRKDKKLDSKNLFWRNKIEWSGTRWLNDVNLQISQSWSIIRYDIIGYNIIQYNTRHDTKQHSTTRHTHCVALQMHDTYALSLCTIYQRTNHSRLPFHTIYNLKISKFDERKTRVLNTPLERKKRMLKIMWFLGQIPKGSRGRTRGDHTYLLIANSNRNS